MKRNTAIVVFPIALVLTFGYFGSALRPFFKEPEIEFGPQIPDDAIAAIHRTCAVHRFGGKKQLTLPSYMEVLRNPQSHKVNPISVTRRSERKIVVRDPNLGMESLLNNLEGTWEQGSFGMRVRN